MMGLNEMGLVKGRRMADVEEHVACATEVYRVRNRLTCRQVIRGRRGVMILVVGEMVYLQNGKMDSPTPRCVLMAAKREVPTPWKPSCL